MPRGKKLKQSSAGGEFAIAFEHFKKGFELLISAAESKKESAETAKSAQKISGGSSEKPSKGEPAFGMYELLEKSKRPVEVEVIAKKLNKSVASIRLYLSKYNCFENVRGKGYRLK